MPKMKTHKGAQARIHVTGRGKLMRRKAHASHLRRKKPKKMRSQYDDKLLLDPSDKKRIQRVIPYGV